MQRRRRIFWCVSMTGQCCALDRITGSSPGDREESSQHRSCKKDLLGAKTNEDLSPDQPITNHGETVSNE